MPRRLVAVAMSGGVDSSLAAAVLKRASYKVYGVYMRLGPVEQSAPVISDLELTCRKLKMSFYQFNFERDFKERVIDYFCQEYSQGRTPNPCIACNQYIKFGRLLDTVRELGVDYLATGHYARIERSPQGYRLLKAMDTNKDQSYFLYTLGQHELKYLLMPLGLLSKAEVREIAAELGLPTSSRSDSQDVCFISGNNYRSFIARHIALQPGDIVDTEGNILGKHKGLARYTVGQKQGLGLNSSERRYVLKLNYTNNRLVVGSKDELYHNTLTAGKLSWVSGKAPKKPINITAKVRYKSPEADAWLNVKGEIAEVRFVKPQRAIAAGQAVVFYHGDEVLGGGTIESTEDVN
jgi:tRNA-specific 2-thiouridylase